MRNAPPIPRPWRLLSSTWLGLLLCGFAAVASAYEGGERLLRLHLPVHLEGGQSVRLDRLIEEHYDVDLNDYLLRGVVIESDGYRDRQHSYARLQVGRYQSARVFIDGGQTAIDAPAYRNDRWQLQLGSGALVHGLLLVLEEQRYSSYRTRPHAGASLGLAWYLSSRDYRYPDFFYRDRYRYGSWANRYDPFYRSGHAPSYYHRDRLRRERHARRHARASDRHHNRRSDRHERRRDRHERRERHENRERNRHDNAHRRDRAKRDHRREHPRQEQQAQRRQWRDQDRRHRDGRSQNRQRGDRQRRAEHREQRPPQQAGSQSRQQRQQRHARRAEQARRGNHEQARRPDRPNRAKVEARRAPRREAAAAPRPQARRQGNSRRESRQAPRGSGNRRGGSHNGGKTVRM